MVVFYHDVPRDRALQALAMERPVSERLPAEALPLPVWPTSPARYVITTQDRFIPPEVRRRVAAAWLGVMEADEIDAGHCVNLSRPDELARLLAGHVD